MTHYSVRQTRRTIRSMHDKCRNTSRNSVSIAKLKTINLEFRKSASWGWSQLPMKSAGNWTRFRQSGNSWHWSSLEVCRCSPDSQTSTKGLSEYIPRWLIHLLHYSRRHIQLGSHQKAILNARSQKTLGKSNWNGPRRQNSYFGSLKRSLLRLQSCSISIKPSEPLSNRTRV